MKLGVISDVHGNAHALRPVLAFLQERVDRLLFLGDLVGYYPFVNECVDMWDEGRIVSIGGNHDQVLTRCIRLQKAPEREYQASYGSALERTQRSLSKRAESLLLSWPTQRRLNLASVGIAMFHGTPWDPLEGRVYPDFTQWERFDDCPEDIILMGHTHYPVLRRRKGKLILNPGSVGQPRDKSGAACCAELDLATGNAVHHRLPYDATALIDDARQHNPHLEFLVQVLCR